MTCLKRIFPGSPILLCKFHVVDYFRLKIIPTCMNTTRTEKDLIIDLIQVMINARDVECFKKAREEFYVKIAGIEVMPPGNREPVLLSDYFSRNWDGDMVQHWALYARRDLETLMENTNNRIERYVSAIILSKGHLRLFLYNKGTSNTTSSEKNSINHRKCHRYFWLIYTNKRSASEPFNVLFV